MSVSRVMGTLKILRMFPRGSPNESAIYSSLNTVFQIAYMKQVSGKDEPLALAAWKSEGDILTLAELMKVGDDKEVFNPHDRVYGLIGLATPEAQRKIVIDYSDSTPTGWSKTYLQCAKVCIQDDPSLSILFMLFERPKCLPLPSWCPNFNANQSRLSILSDCFNAGILKVVEIEDELPKAWVEEDKDILFAPGCRVDLVKEIVSSTLISGFEGLSAVRNLAWERQCQSLSQQTLGTGIETDVLYIQTLIENSVILGKDNADLRQLLDHIKYVWSEGSWNAECIDIEGEMDAAAHFYKELRHACQDRTFFCTKGGRIGIGPRGIQPGDLICILYGAQPLYVLRREGNGKEPLQILGDAFVHGCMDLDDMYEEVKSSYEVFEIG